MQRILRNPYTIVLLFSSIAMLWLGPRFVLPQIGGYLIANDPLPNRRADALIPLAGEVKRIEDAKHLFDRDTTEWFVITNMYVRGAPKTARFYVFQNQKLAIEYGVPPRRIILNTQSVKTTYEEAQSIRYMAEQHGWTSLIIVTSPSHTRRSRIIFRDVFRETDIQISIRAMENHWYTSETWWNERRGWQQTVTEYGKMVAHFLHIR